MKMYARLRDRAFVIDDGKLNHIELDPDEARLAVVKINTFLEALHEEDRRKEHGHPLKAFEPSCKHCRKENRVL